APKARSEARQRHRPARSAPYSGPLHAHKIRPVRVHDQSRARFWCHRTVFYAIGVPAKRAARWLPVPRGAQESRVRSEATIRWPPTTEELQRMSNVDQARALLSEALGFLDASDFKAAEARLRKALRLLPTSAAILTNLSVALLRQGKRSAARDCAAKAIAADPRNVEALLVLADCHTHASDLNTALDDYDRIVALEPRLAEAHNNRGLVLHRLLRPAEAL